MTTSEDPTEFAKIPRERFLQRCLDKAIQDGWTGPDVDLWQRFMMTPTGMRLLGTLMMEGQAIGQRALGIQIREDQAVLMLAGVQGQAVGLHATIDKLCELSQPETDDVE